MLPKAFIFFLFLIWSWRSISCVEFVNNLNFTLFTTTNTLAVGATFTSPPSILTLTKPTPGSIGRALYPSRIPTAEFATSFIFSMVSPKNVYYGDFSFVLLPSSKTANATFHVELNSWLYDKFNPNLYGVALETSSTLFSRSTADAGFYGGRDGERFTNLNLNSGDNYQAWIEFNGSAINVTVARPGSRKPVKPLLSSPLHLTEVFVGDMFVGFTGTTHRLSQTYRILSWSFSNSNISIGDALVTKNLPSFKLQDKSVFRSKGFIVGISVVVVLLLLLCVIGFFCFYVVRRQKMGLEDHVEDWETEYWPHKVQYKSVLEATKGFSEENMIGYGGNSKVYRGVLECKQVAVKRIMISSREGTSEFLAEVSSLGRLRHTNIVGLRGWCKKGGESLILVYEYMENGSVDKRIFDCDDMLNWKERMRVIRDVASGILYLHEGWESQVLHRDIKSSNVLLDKDMNAKVGDFGLAKLQNTRKERDSTTLVVGTVGYMPPELLKTGKASTQTDVYSFGVLVLEVVSGRRPIEEGREGIVERIWGLTENDKLLDGLDERIKETGLFETEEVVMVLRIGLLCVHPDPRVRPKMRQVVQILEQGRLSDDGGEREREGMEESLLERVNRSFSMGIGEGRQQYPTFQDVWNSSSLPISLGNSDSIFQAR